MNTLHEGEKSVLVVVDAQAGVLGKAWDAPRIIKNIVNAVEKARRQGVPVIWVQHSDSELVYGSLDWQLLPEFSPIEGDIQIDKHFNSSFEKTSLEETLARVGATHIVLAGAATNWCIRATAYGALDRGYDLTLIEDGHTTETIAFEDGTRIEAADIILELNVVMKWLSYPDRTNDTVSVEELDFDSCS